MASRKGTAASRSSTRLESSHKSLPDPENAVDPVEDMMDRFACEAVVVEVIQDVCVTASEQMLKRELEREGIPFTVTNALRDIRRVARLGFMSRETDRGEFCVDGNFYNKFSGDWALAKQDEESSGEKQTTGQLVRQSEILDSGRKPTSRSARQSEILDSGRKPTTSRSSQHETLDSFQSKGATLANQRWAGESEPRPAIIDSWARGAVPLKPVHSAYDDAMSKLGRGKNSLGPASDFDRKSFRSTSRYSTKTRQRLQHNADKNKSLLAPTQEHEQVMIIEIDARDDDSLRRGLGPIVFGNPNEMSFEEENGEDPFMQDAKKLEEMKANEERRKLELEREEQELMALHEKTSKELKGKPFFFEPDGRLVVVRNVKGDNLPPSSYTLPVNITDFVPEAEDGLDGFDDTRPIENLSSARSASVKDKSVMSRSRGPSVNQEDGVFRSSSSRNRSRGSMMTSAQRLERQRRRQERKEKRLSKFYEVSPSLQPSILSTMELSPGVSVTENGSVVTGPLLSEDPQKMTKKEYTLRHNLPHGSRGNTGAQKPLGSTNGRKASNVSSLISPGPIHDADSAFTDPTAFMAFNDAELTPREDLSYNSHPRTGRSAKTAAYAELDEDDPHLKLIQAPEWGQNSVGEPTPPVRPTTKRTTPAADLYAKKTRDRMHPDIITFTSEKKKLSAPPLGVTTGHGMSQLFDRALLNKSLNSTSSRNLLFPPVVGATPNPNRPRRPSSDQSKGSFSSHHSGSHKISGKIFRQKDDDNIRTLLFD